MRIICPVKRVPDTAAAKVIDPDDKTLNRDAGEAILNANDEWSIEEAMRIKERTPGTEVIVLCMGPEQAQTTVRKALSYGLDGAIQVTDPAIHGSDAAATARVLAAALREEFDLIIMGNQSSDARTTLVPAMLAEFLDLPALTYVRKLDIDGTKLTAQRETSSGYMVVEAEGPAIVSVVEAINEPRYPSFKGIMAAKSKPLATKALGDLGVDAGEVGLDNSWTQIVEATPRPPKQAGEKVEDDGSGTVGAQALAEFLAAKKFI